MKETDPRHIPPEPDKTTAAELAWLKENLHIFWAAAEIGYRDEGRGALVIDAYSEPLGQATQFHYTPQAQFEEQEDEVSGRMVEYISEYNPRHEFVAVIISQPEEEYEFRLYHLDARQELVEAVKLEAESEVRPQLSSAGTELDETLEPPDLETLIQWESEGGCEAACPYSCWVEPDVAPRNGEVN